MTALTFCRGSEGLALGMGWWELLLGLGHCARASCVFGGAGADAQLLRRVLLRRVVLWRDAVHHGHWCDASRAEWARGCFLRRGPRRPATSRALGPAMRFAHTCSIDQGLLKFAAALWVDSADSIPAPCMHLCRQVAAAAYENFPSRMQCRPTTQATFRLETQPRQTASRACRR